MYLLYEGRGLVNRSGGVARRSCTWRGLNRPSRGAGDALSGPKSLQGLVGEAELVLLDHPGGKVANRVPAMNLNIMLEVLDLRAQLRILLLQICPSESWVERPSRESRRAFTDRLSSKARKDKDSLERERR